MICAPHNNAALRQLNLSLSLRQIDPTYGTPRKESMIKTGYSVYKKGQLIQEYEFDSKSVDNLYYAFMHRHNSNRILPDPKIVHDFKMFSLGVINAWISNMRPVEEINIVSVHDFIKSKTGWEPNKKN